MIDSSVVFGYSLMGVGSGMVNRAMQYLLPTPLERAQVESVWQNLKLSRDRLIIEQRRAEAEWKLRRKLLQEQLSAGSETERDRVLMQRWPLEVPAAALVRYSQSKGGNALSVIVRQEPRKSTSSYTEEQAQEVWTAFSLATDRMIGTLREYLSDDVIYYRETQRSERGLVLYGDQLIASLYSLTRTEPVVLLQVNIEDESSLRVTWSGWGWLGDGEGPRSGSVNIALGDSVPKSSQMEQALLAIIGALSDQYQCVRRLLSPVAPRSLRFINRLPNAAFLRKIDGSHEPDRESGRELVVRSYMTAITQVCENAPAIGLASLNVAEQEATQLGETDLAQMFKALGDEYRIRVEQGSHAEGQTEEIVIFGSRKGKKGAKPDRNASFLDIFKGIIPDDNRRIYEVLSYDHVIPYSTSDKPIDVASSRSVLIVRTGDESSVLVQSFVDEDDYPIYGADGHMIGRSLLFRELDRSLEELFDGKTFVVIE